MSDLNAKNVNEMSRRKFLHGAGTSVAMLALGGGVGAVLGAYSQKEAAASERAEASWPFRYNRIDPDVAAKRGYEGYFRDG